MKKQTVDVRYFLETASKHELIELLRRLKALNQSGFNEFTNAIENMIG